MKKMSQAEWIAVALGVVVIIVIFYLFVPFRFFGNSVTELNRDVNTGTAAQIVTDSGLIIQDLVVGEGKRAAPGKALVVHYVGKLSNGTPFDSSVERGEPFVFVLGQGNVIKGWDEGLVDMQVGGRRVLRIPPRLGYGASGTGNIPPNSELIFEVVLLDVFDPPSN